MDELTTLRLKLQMLEADIVMKQTEVAPLKAERDAVKDTIAADRNETAERIYALEKQIREQREELEKRQYERTLVKTALDESIFDVQQDLRRKQREAESIQRQIEQAERAAINQAEWKTLEQRWDALTLGAPWREWAKDHQLDAARKITYEGSLILGDTMGLGKTLSAIIAMDMIQAATKDASPDHPVEFGSMK